MSNISSTIDQLAGIKSWPTKLLPEDGDGFRVITDDVDEWELCHVCDGSPYDAHDLACLLSMAPAMLAFVLRALSSDDPALAKEAEQLLTELTFRQDACN